MKRVLAKYSSSARWAIGGRLNCRTSFALASPDALNDPATGTGSEALVKILSHGGSHYLTVATVACELAEGCSGGLHSIRWDCVFEKARCEVLCENRSNNGSGKQQHEDHIE
jgi:hypothetical protein